MKATPIQAAPLPPGWRDENGKLHGTPGAYNKGCRCVDCRRANADHNRHWRATHGNTHLTPLMDMSWQADAACKSRDVSPDLFYAPHGERDAARRWREQNARAVCAECPCRQRCLSHALRYDEQGIWGGTTDVQREQMKRRRK
jgi:WhiB family redox-sensing transcriptional regulator